MKLSEIKGERALEVVADLIDPVGELLGDKEFEALVRNKDRNGAMKYLLKNKSKNVITVLAIINGEDPSTYEPSLLTLPMMLMDLLNDSDLLSLFGLQGQNTDEASSGPATESIEADKQ